MKKLFYLFLVLLVCSCANYTKPPVEGFKIHEASFNKWVGGQPGASGIKVTIVYESKESIDFQKVYFQQKTAATQVKKEKGKTYLYGFINTSKKQDNVVLDIDPRKENNNKTPIVNLPFKLKDDEVALSYTLDNQTKYYIVKGLKETKSQYFP